MQESSVSHHRHLFPPLTGAHLAVFNSSHRKQQCADHILSSQRCPSDRDPRTTPRAPWLLTEPLKAGKIPIDVTNIADLAFGGLRWTMISAFW